ncbi:MAG: hypothetical protein WDW38_003958 [Sanguina aurantia]
MAMAGKMEARLHTLNTHLIKATRAITTSDMPLLLRSHDNITASCEWPAHTWSTLTAQGGERSARRLQAAHHLLLVTFTELSTAAV